jgi:hypothetical protein
MMLKGAVCRWSQAGLVLLGAAFVACAGADVPAVDAKLAEDIANVYLPGRGNSGAGGAAPGGGGSGGASALGEGGSGSNMNRGGSASGDAGVGGSASVDAGSGGNGGGDCDGFQILKQRCGTSAGCHAAGSPYSAFADTAASAADFAGEDAVGFECSGEGPIFDPVNPEQSLVILKTAAGSSACGARMPITGEPLTTEEIECVQAFIESL